MCFLWGRNLFLGILCRRISVLKELNSWTPRGDFVLHTENSPIFLWTACSLPYWQQLSSYLSYLFFSLSKICSTKASYSLSNPRSLDSSVSLVTMLRAAWPRDSGSIPWQRQQIFTFIGLCLVIYFYSKTNKMHQCIKFILFWNDTLHVSDGLSVHHQQFKTVHTATGICQTDTAVCLLASIQQFDTVMHLVSFTIAIGFLFLQTAQAGAVAQPLV